MLYVDMWNDARILRRSTPVADLPAAQRLIQETLDATPETGILCGFRAMIDDAHGNILYEGETKANLWGIQMVNPASWQLDVEGGRYREAFTLRKREVTHG